jgi:signal transduction histidine kinase
VPLFVLQVFLFLPFLLLRQTVWFYVALGFIPLSQFFFGLCFTQESKPLLCHSVAVTFMLGPLHVLNTNILQPIALQLWGNAILVHGAKIAFCALISFALNMFVWRFCVKHAKRMLDEFETWAVVGQFCLVLVITMVLLFSLAHLSAVLVSGRPALAASLLALNFFYYFMIAIVDFIAFFFTVRSAERNEHAANLKQKELEAQLNKEYADLMERNAARFERWQHDTNHLLNVLRLSATDPHIVEAADEIVRGICISAVPHYTDNVLLNATLALKAEEARASYVVLDMDIALPKQVIFTDIELIRAFKNLIDNAVRAAAVLPSQSDRVVQITCRENAGFLYIRTRNHYSKEHTPHGTGKGCEIVRKLAVKYQGHFTSAPHDGEWFATLALKL